jgi:hypothetical protein
VVEVCRRLDGIPLAIELAAARVTAMTPADIAGHLDERFRLLTGGRRARVERHQTLGAAVEWSYSLLSDTERVVFDRLGVFPADFDEPAAVAVCADEHVGRWEVIDGLGSLVGKSMLGAERSGPVVRYQLLETLRHFARQQIPGAGKSDRLRRRHASHYAEFAERAGAGLASPAELQWRPRILAELDNLRAAAGWAFDSPVTEDSVLGARIIAGLVPMVWAEGRHEMQTWASASQVPTGQLAERYAAVIDAVVGLDAYQTGQFDRAVELGRRALDDPAPISLASQLAAAAVCLSLAASGDPHTAMAVLDDYRRRLDAAGGDRELETYGARALCAILAGQMGDRDTAQLKATEAVTVMRRIGWPSVLASALGIYASVLVEIDRDAALAAATEATALVDAGAGGNALSMAPQAAAVALVSRGDVASAARAISRAVAYGARVGDKDGVAVSVVFAVLVLAANQESRHAAAVLAGTLAGAVFGRLDAFATVDRRRYERCLDKVAASLGADDFALARVEGESMTFDQIVTFALDALDRALRGG